MPQNLWAMYKMEKINSIKDSLSFLQRKSNRAKEKKEKRKEERAAMDAVCAKVDAANKVRGQGDLGQ